ncbi:MarR family transcriptional regulator [Aequorivita sp. H23M31]|uniref:MarR family transcriptional regulator n=1 Tax=Aequorivita ciconiae TaxID=2494375 RepID=A0A410G0V2_9FLAO|nr:MarR family winged helix-turn-helix transcriptional regulator [Aequorivita sp. H23M31]QAA80903.1 MarR family transcriptional regulator [Aequorivita sp. H23M31]
MKYDLINEVLKLVQEFERQIQNGFQYSNDVEGFKEWIAVSVNSTKAKIEPAWEAKEYGRSPESVINTLIVHMNRYARSYSKAAIYDSDFSTQEDFIYLINLKAFGAMTKMELIKKNVHEKSVGIQIINRLIKQGWVVQTDSKQDKRSKLVAITKKGLKALENLMDKVRKASEIVVGDLNHDEKMELIRLLNKLNDFHNPIYLKNLDSSELLDEVIQEMENK